VIEWGLSGLKNLFFSSKNLIFCQGGVGGAMQSQVSERCTRSTCKAASINYGVTMGEWSLKNHFS